MYSYCTGSFTVLHSYNTAIVLEQELIFLGKPRKPLVLTRFREYCPFAALLGIAEAASAAIPEQRPRHPLLSYSLSTASASESDRASSHHTRVSLNLWHADPDSDRLSRVGKISVRHQSSIETLFFCFHLWNSSLYLDLYYPSSETVFFQATGFQGLRRSAFLASRICVRG